MLLRSKVIRNEVVNHRDVEGEDVDLANWRETHGFCHKLCMELDVAGTWDGRQ